MSSPTIIEYVATGLTAQFVIPFAYLQASYVKVYVGGVETLAFTFVSSSIIQLTTTPPVNTSVKIQRQTPTDSLVTYNNATSLTADALNIDSRQSLMLIEELQDASLADAESAYNSALSAAASATAAAASVPSVIFYRAGGVAVDISGMTNVIVIKTDDTADVVQVIDSTGKLIDEAAEYLLSNKKEFVHLIYNTTDTLWYKI